MKHWLIIHQKYIWKKKKKKRKKKRKKHWIKNHQKNKKKKKKKKRKQTGYYLEPLTTETLKISIGNN